MDRHATPASVRLAPAPVRLPLGTLFARRRYRHPRPGQHAGGGLRAGRHGPHRAITDPQCVEPREAVTVHCEARDQELLFVEWLNTLVFEMATRGMIFAHFGVSIAGTSLDGTACGEPVNVARHQPAAEVKGATYTALRVARDADGTWVAQCVVDV
jgi:protein archease